MVASQERHPVRQVVALGVAENKSGPHGDDSCALEMRKVRIEPYFAQRHNYFDGAQYGQFPVKILGTVRQFTRERLVVWRSAAHGRRDVTVRKFQPVIPALGSGLRGKSNLVQYGIHELARRVSCKWPAGAV